MSAPDALLSFGIVAAVTVVILGYLSEALATRWPLSDPLIAMLAGLALGPHGWAWLHLDELATAHVVEQAARITLGAALVSAAYELPANLWAQRRSIGLLLSVGMVGMWLATSTLAWAVLDLPMTMALLVGAVLAPTDPVLAGGILSGPLAHRVVPERLRTVMIAESAVNDGLALPFVLFAIHLSNTPLPDSLERTAVHGVGWQVGLGIATGAAIGGLAGLLLRGAERTLNAGGAPAHASSFALAALVLVAGRALDVDAVLSVFVGGLAFIHASGHAGDARWGLFPDTAKRLLELPLFLLLGTLLPLDAWAERPALAFFAASTLLLRRLPVVAALRRGLPEAKGLPALLFAGWFGPMGTAALFYAMTAVQRSGQPEVWTITSAAIAASVLAHGITATPALRWLSRHSVAENVDHS